MIFNLAHIYALYNRPVHQLAGTTSVRRCQPIGKWCQQLSYSWCFFCRRNLCNVSTSTWTFHFNLKKVLLINLSTEGFYPVYRTSISLMIDILCTRIFTNALKYGFHGEKYISQKKVLLIDTSTEEFYLVHENSTYNSLLLYPSSEGIFLLFQIVISISGKIFHMDFGIFN